MNKNTTTKLDCKISLNHSFYSINIFGFIIILLYSLKNTTTVYLIIYMY